MVGILTKVVAYHLQLSITMPNSQTSLHIIYSNDKLTDFRWPSFAQMCRGVILFCPMGSFGLHPAPRSTRIQPSWPSSQLVSSRDFPLWFCDFCCMMYLCSVSESLARTAIRAFNKASSSLASVIKETNAHVRDE